MKNKIRTALGLFIFFLLTALISACSDDQPLPAADPGTSSGKPAAVDSGLAPKAPAGIDPVPAVPAIVATTGWPAAFVPEPEYGFGTVVDGAKIIHEFIIENQGEAPLLISYVTTGCSCAVPEYPRTIFPGDKGKIIITIDTNGYGGREFSKDIRVSTNEPNNSMLHLLIYGPIDLFADIAPKSLFLKGLAGENVQETAIITHYKEYPFRITGFELEDKLKEVVSIDIARKGETSILTAKNKMKAPGQYFGKLIIKTDSSIKPEINILIRGTIK